MSLGWTDLAVFAGFMALVMGVSLWAGRRERNVEDYFLAGRQLSWWLIGFSLIATNISTEHFVGMAGSAYGRVGLAIASYEWMAAVTLVLVAWWLLPTFLSAGIYTMPEFLEYRFDAGARALFAVYLLVAYVVVFLATVLFSGTVALNAIFDVPAVLSARFGLDAGAASRWANVAGVWTIGLVAGIYTVYGGLKAVVWSDLLQGAALLLGGAAVAVLGLSEMGGGSWAAGWEKLCVAGADKLHVVLPWDDPDVPWLAVFVGGLWIPNLFYWGLNQFITQRTLAARDLAEGQKGIFLAAAIKLLIPFIIVLPGIMAFELYGDSIRHGDQAYPTLIARILPPELRGAMLAALAGAVMSSFNSGLNSAATIFTIDLYGKYVRRDAPQAEQVRVGRIATAVLIAVACLWAPMIAGFEGVFRYIQEIWGFITPGVVAVFAVGLLSEKTPPLAAKTALLLSPVLYGLCRFGGAVLPALRPFNQIAFLHHMLLVFMVLVLVMLLVTGVRPLRTPVRIPVSAIDVTPHPRQYLLGAILIAVTAMLYVRFW
jgi:SSS family solute:Na+ symporter